MASEKEASPCMPANQNVLSNLKDKWNPSHQVIEISAIDLDPLKTSMDSFTLQLYPVRHGPDRAGPRAPYYWNLTIQVNWLDWMPTSGLYKIEDAARTIIGIAWHCLSLVRLRRIVESRRWDVSPQPATSFKQASAEAYIASPHLWKKESGAATRKVWEDITKTTLWIQRYGPNSPGPVFS